MTDKESLIYIRRMETIRIEDQNVISEFKWLFKALSSDPAREVLNYVKIEDGLAITTDGRRLHRLKCSELPVNFEDWEEGVYKVLTVKKDLLILEQVNDLNYPNWQQVYRDPERAHNSSVLRICGSGQVSSICLAAKAAYNVHYLIDACGFGTVYRKTEEMGCLIRYESQPFQCPVYIQDGIRSAVVMPYRFECQNHD